MAGRPGATSVTGLMVFMMLGPVAMSLLLLFVGTADAAEAHHSSPAFDSSTGAAHELLARGELLKYGKMSFSEEWTSDNNTPTTCTCTCYPGGAPPKATPAGTPSGTPSSGAPPGTPSGTPSSGAPSGTPSSKPPSQRSPVGRKRSPPPAPYWPSPGSSPVSGSPAAAPNSKSPVSFATPPPSPVGPYGDVPSYEQPAPAVVTSPDTFVPSPPPPAY